MPHHLAQYDLDHHGAEHLDQPETPPRVTPRGYALTRRSRAANPYRERLLPNEWTLND